MTGFGAGDGANRATVTLTGAENDTQIVTIDVIEDDT